jgi:hypothetical protein
MLGVIASLRLFLGLCRLYNTLQVSIKDKIR